MYNTIKQYADDFQPLTRSEELEILSSNLDDSELFLSMIQHNARLIIKAVMRWRSTYDLDDATSIVLTKLLRTFNRWDRKISFYYFARLRISAALHESHKDHLEVSIEDLDNFDVIDKNSQYYTGLFDDCEELLSADDYDLIDSVYRQDKLVKDSTVLASSSRKHQEILRRLRRDLDDSRYI